MCFSKYIHNSFVPVVLCFGSPALFLPFIELSFSGKLSFIVDFKVGCLTVVWAYAVQGRGLATNMYPCCVDENGESDLNAWSTGVCSCIKQYCL